MIFNILNKNHSLENFSSSFRAKKYKKCIQISLNALFFQKKIKFFVINLFINIYITHAGLLSAFCLLITMILHSILWKSRLWALTPQARYATLVGHGYR